MMTPSNSVAVLRNKEAGQSIILLALALVVLLGFMGFGIDMGILRYEKRIEQTAADAAALAGASNLALGGVVAGGQNASALDGFTDTGGGNVASCGSSAVVGTVCVQINNPPASGPHSGDANYVEALVASVQPTYFARVVGIDQETVMARAVATDLSGATSTGGCLYTLGPPSSSIEGVNVQGSAVLNAPSCGIVDNGNFNTKGNKLIVSAETFGTSGDWQKSGPGGTVTCEATPDSCPTVNMPAGPNPLAGLTPPCNPCTGGGTLSSTGNATFNPGTYSSISLSGNGTVTFNPGVYVIDGSGGFSCSGTPTITGTGVMFYFTNSATINCQGNDTLELTAPSPTNCAACPSEYDGILMYQDPNDTNTTGPGLGGNTGSFLDGVLYFPKDQLTFFGNNSSLDVAMVIADSLQLSGNPTVTLEGAGGLPPGVTNIITVATLVE
jgi:Putative Flp pilus-assembly TadE/G-like